MAFWVPLDAERSIADLIAALGLPAVLVARNGLGVLSHTRAAYEALTQRAVHVAAIVLTEHGVFDESQQDNLSHPERAAADSRRALPEQP
ncbi:MAG: AAA family ATPase [Sandaracinaceae bacterium]|nr:AAA family ATPase [Sandaracinaceae bacterium]